MNSKDNKAGEDHKQATPAVYNIPFEGSLGLLALGAVGIRAWRKKRQEMLENQKKK